DHDRHHIRESHFRPHHHFVPFAGGGAAGAAMSVTIDCVSMVVGTLSGCDRISPAAGKSCGRIWASSASHSIDHSLNQDSLFELSRQKEKASMAFFSSGSARLVSSSQ